MRILYDGAIYSVQRAGGINRYFAELISRLPSSWTPILATVSKPDTHVLEHSQLQWQQCDTYRGPKAWVKWRRRRFFRQLYANTQADVVHPTSYRLLSNQALASLRQPLVVTVYDMIHERFPELVDRRRRNARLKQAAILAARRIICISESTRRDLLEFYPEVEDRVSVIHLAADLGPAAEIDGPEEQAAYAPPEFAPPRCQDRTPYFLYVGSRAAYKNFDRLLRAMQAVVSRDPRVRLVVAGSCLTRHEQQQIAALGLAEHVETLTSVTDEELRALYHHALALVYPSRYEGFGIPVLEAMACQTVVVAANTSSIPEVAGDAALLFDPPATDELADILSDLLTHPEQRQPLIERGLVRVRQFSWDKTAAATWKVYQAACERVSTAPPDHVVPRQSLPTKHRVPAA
ncbi:MAG TPA: glycosyltransferase family 1 protein [Planctomycetaceae bacterium]|nr:mannosyltransferase [Blastopirellula sp.]HAY78375.1 glycosyltransferase family 1 protein [Planctomycetaceae bacterium]